MDPRVASTMSRPNNPSVDYDAYALHAQRLLLSYHDSLLKQLPSTPGPGGEAPVPKPVQLVPTQVIAPKPLPAPRMLVPTPGWKEANVNIRTTLGHYTFWDLPPNHIQTISGILTCGAFHTHACPPDKEYIIKEVFIMLESFSKCPRQRGSVEYRDYKGSLPSSPCAPSTLIEIPERYTGDYRHAARCVLRWSAGIPAGVLRRGGPRFFKMQARMAFLVLPKGAPEAEGTLVEARAEEWRFSVDHLCMTEELRVATEEGRLAVAGAHLQRPGKQA